MNERKPFVFEAVIFDLDGVITQTAVVHTKAWKKVFDAFLQKKAKENNIVFREFTQNDYLSYVDGKPRYQGVKSLLEARKVEIPWGTEDDGPDLETVCGLGNKKNEIFNDILETEGAEVYPSTKEIILELHQANVKLGVASSSKNCKAVLRAVGLLPLFEARVDGVVSAQLKLKGKPAPDIFTKACEILSADPSRSIVVEDAVSGVQAGEKGGFGLVLGIARKNNENELQQNGADYVIKDFNELQGIYSLNELFQKFRKK